jgi:hypothetical protein
MMVVVVMMTVHIPDGDDSNMHTNGDDRSVHLYAVNTYRGEEVQLHCFLTSTPDWGSGQLQAPAALPRERTVVPTAQESCWASQTLRRSTSRNTKDYVAPVEIRTRNRPA